jgi:hypothetical protein
MFLFAIRADETRRQYLSKLKAFFDFLDLSGSMEEQAQKFVILATKDPGFALLSLMRFVNFHKDRVLKKEITESTLRNYFKPVKLFCEVNEIQVNWKRLAKGIPRARKASNDRAPTLEEIRKLANYPDRRIKPILYTMVSSGIRLGAWDHLRWGDVEPVIRDGVIVAAKMVVYSGDAEQYQTFITPEAYHALKDWMDYRTMAGEKITNESWVMRNLWDATHYHRGLATHPDKLKSTGLKRLVERALWAQGIRKPLKDGTRRHEFKADHGFRKYFKTRAEQVMRPVNVEILMGHSIGISDSYYRPTEKDLLEDYLKAVDSLSILTETKIKADLEKAIESRIEAAVEKKLQELLDKVDIKRLG